MSIRRPKKKRSFARLLAAFLAISLTSTAFGLGSCTVTPPPGTSSAEPSSPGANPRTPDNFDVPNQGAVPGDNVTIAGDNESAFKVVGYISYWEFGHLSDVQLNKLTHLIWQGVTVSGADNASLQLPANTPSTQISEAAKAGHASGIKVYASLMAAHGTDDFNRVVASAALRKQLVGNLKTLVLGNGLDGLDLDCESSPDINSFSLLLKELYDAFNPLGKDISIAASPDRIDVEPSVARYLSFISVMTYDLYKGAGYPYHSQFDESVRWLNFWAAAGVSPEKLLMGIPIFGRDQDSGYYAYRYIVAHYDPSPETDSVFDPATNETVWWNGPDLVRHKVRYVKGAGFGGVMMYEVGIDAAGPNSLLEAVYQEFSRN